MLVWSCLTIVLISDSDESVRREVGIMIPQFSFEHWKKTEEPLFQNGKVQFNEEKFIHIAHS